MTTSTRTDIVFLALHEILIGLAAGAGGVLVTAAVGAGLTPLVDLYDSILYALLAGGLSMLLGVAAVGYRYLRQQGRRQRFGRQLGQGAVGFGLGLGLFFALLWTVPRPALTNGLTNAALVIMPLLGLLLGFNHRIRHEW